MRRIVQLSSLVLIGIVAIAPAPAATFAAPVAELEIRVTAADGATPIVRVASVSADANGELQVFERRAPFSWRVPDGTVNVIAQTVGRTDITVEMMRPDLMGPDGISRQRTTGTGPTIVLHSNLGRNGYGVVVLP